MLAQIDDSWSELFNAHQLALTEIAVRIEGQPVTPAIEKIMRVFSLPRQSYRAVIVGQDPYPTPNYANGLAFSVNAEVTKLPASLKNIFREYVSDTGYQQPANGDLSRWATNGVALLNTSLSLNLANKNEHLSIGWQDFTSAALELLRNQGAVAILWGNHAQRIGAVFPKTQKIESVHPSPLSAYRGFFQSKPFSRCNSILQSSGQKPIDWRLE